MALRPWRAAELATALAAATVEGGTGAEPRTLASTSNRGPTLGYSGACAMEDLIFTPIVLVAGLAIHAVVLRFHDRAEGQLLTVAFAGHVVAGFTQVLLVLYYFSGGGDMLTYYREGVVLASLLRDDFWRFAPELVQIFFQQEGVVPFDFYGGASTASMSCVAAFLMFVVGDSLYAGCQLVALGAYLSQVLLFRALLPGTPRDDRRALLIGLLLLPSAVFWSSGILKEPVVFCALGPLILALRWFSTGKRRVLAVVLAAGSAPLIAVIKPYVLIALSIGAAVYYLSLRFQSRDVVFRPLVVVTAVALGFGGLTLASRYFAKAEAESTASALAAQRRVGYDVEGGSNYYLDSPSAGEDVTQRSLTQELALVPVALVTAFFRPFLFEARNAVQAANALEATALLVLSVQIVRRRRWRTVVAEIRRSPELAFCAAFALVLAVGTGLATSNLGTLSRYRAPMMPFFFALLMVLRRPLVDQRRVALAANVEAQARRRGMTSAPAVSR